MREGQTAVAVGEILVIKKNEGQKLGGKRAQLERRSARTHSTGTHSRQTTGVALSLSPQSAGGTAQVEALLLSPEKRPGWGDALAVPMSVSNEWCMLGCGGSAERVRGVR